MTRRAVGAVLVAAAAGVGVYGALVFFTVGIPAVTAAVLLAAGLGLFLAGLADIDVA